MSAHQITVSPKKNANGVFEWTVTYGKQSGSKPGEYPVIKLPQGGTNERFVITLFDPTYGIEFSNDPLWIQTGSCPTEPGIDTRLIDKFDPGQTVIKFRDLNSNASELSLWYRLNFKINGLNAGDPGTFLDPEIRNGGSGGPGTPKWLAAVAIAAAAAVAFAAYQAYFDH